MKDLTDRPRRYTDRPADKPCRYGWINWAEYVVVGALEIPALCSWCGACWVVLGPDGHLACEACDHLNEVEDL